MDRPEHPAQHPAPPLDPAERADPKTGVSDDPRVDPTPEQRQSDPERLTDSPSRRA